MQLDLNPEEQRVLGCLIEKCTTTPEYYPLTINALVAACNQKSNRDPQVAYDERTVQRALDSLRHRKLAGMMSSSGARVPKYEQTIAGVIKLSSAEIAVIAELMLRGPQTPGELRGRCERMCPLSGIEEVESVLDRLKSLEDPLVVCLPKQPGRKEHRWAHLLGGPIDVEAMAEAAAEPIARYQPVASPAVSAETAATLAEMQADVAALKETLAALRAEFDSFRSQF